MAKKCLCGCGNPVNPGRSYVHGHNRKNEAAVKDGPDRVALKVKRKTRGRKRKIALRIPVLEVIDELVKRQEKISKLIETLRDVY